VTNTVLNKFFGALLFLGFCSTAAAELKAPKALPQMRNIITLGVVDGESNSKTSAVNIRFLSKPEWPKTPEFDDHGSFLQLNLPNVIVPEPGKFIDGNSIYIKKIAIFQMTPNDASIRLFLSESAKKVKEALNYELLGNRIVVTLDHASLIQSLNPIVAELTGPPAPTAAAKIIANTKIDRSIPPPANALKNAEQTIGRPGPDFRKKMVNISLFCGALLIIFLSILVAKPYFRKKRMASNEESIEMKTIGTLVLASKQKLSLVQIGDEKILLGVTPENISFITVVGSTSKVSIPQALASAPTNSDFAELLQETAAPAPAPEPVKPAKRIKLKTKPAENVTRPEPTIQTKPRPIKRKTQYDLNERNDTESLQLTPKSRPTRPSPRIGATKGSKVNIAVGEEGVQHVDTMNANIQSSRTKIKKGDENAQAIEDVTRLIRNKLKTLKSL
jgi:flagellar biogenesis protein FliO